MDADTLVRAIRAALDETERIALAADGSRWYLDLDEGGVVEHFERNDPAAVLRRVAADRELLAEHAVGGPFCDECDLMDGAELKNATCGHFPRYCRRCWRNEDTREEYPCRTLRALARGLGINPEEETP